MSMLIRHPKWIFTSIVMVGVVAHTGCATHHDSAAVIHPASDCPDHFVAKGSVAAVPSDAARNPMVDPRNGTEIILVRSDRGWGDYQVPEGSYGVNRGELLRLDPATGRVIGIVQK
jgi:hypothetical protein